jgi:phosphate-selective porin OprO/OprP
VCLAVVLGGALATRAAGPADTATADQPGAPQPPAAAPTPASPPAALTGPERLEQEVRVVVATNPPPTTSSGTNAPVPRQKWFTWNVAWKGWDGLQMEAVQRTPLANPWKALDLNPTIAGSLAYLQLEQVKLTATFGGRLDLDGAAFTTTGNLNGFDDGFQVRRVRVAAGGDFILVLPASYYLDFGYAGNFYLYQSTLTFPAIKYIGNIQIGQFQAPMGLDLITSSRDITFMESAAPLQALAPGILAGIQIGQPVFNDRATWALGLFAPGAGSSEYGNASRNYGSAIARATWLPFYHPDSTNSSANRLLHLGLSANVLYSSTSTVRYQSRPESYIAPHIIDTGDIAANSAATFAAEAAWVNGPFSVQGEFIGSAVGENEGSTLGFYGFYGYASWYLTGESRRYNTTSGAFGRLVPRHNFDFGRGGWGAVEISSRFSYTDLTDGNVQGGRLSLLMSGVNWYLTPHVRWMFNYGFGHVTGGPSQGNMNIFQTRIGMDF